MRQAGREAGSDDLVAWALATRSIGPYFGGNHTAATELLRRAQSAGSQSGARRLAWINALMARSSAASGDFDACRRALDAAHHHIQNVTEPPRGDDFFDAVRLDGMTGTAYMLMRDSAKAMPLLRAAIERRPSKDVKGRALLGLDLAECHLHAGAADEAERLAVTVFEWADGSIVEPIVKRATELRGALVRQTGTSGACELTNRLVEFTHGS